MIAPPAQQRHQTCNRKRQQPEKFGTVWHELVFIRPMNNIKSRSNNFLSMVASCHTLPVYELTRFAPNNYLAVLQFF
jgi:hypothetical protein